MRKAMEARGYEQTGLADLMKVSDSTVSRWLDGAAPDPDQLARLATLLDVTTDELLRPEAAAGVAERVAPYGARKKSEDELLLRKYEAVLRPRIRDELRSEFAAELQRVLDRWAKRG